MWRLNRRGQAVFEYAVILGIVVLALSLMQTYVRRGIQAGMKVAADELGRQEDSVEMDPAKGTTQTAIARTVVSAQHQLEQTRGAGQSRSVSEQTETVPVDADTPSQNTYWSNWEEEE